MMWNWLLRRRLGYMLTGGTTMRFAFFAAAMALALALPMLSVRAADPPADIPEYGTGRMQTPETGAGGAPASSPQGQTPLGMQAAPDGSSKTTVAPNKDK
jgi:hypothetical protein